MRTCGHANMNASSDQKSEAAGEGLSSSGQDILRNRGSGWRRERGGPLTGGAMRLIHRDTQSGLRTTGCTVWGVCVSCMVYEVYVCHSLLCLILSPLSASSPAQAPPPKKEIGVLATMLLVTAWDPSDCSPASPFFYGRASFFFNK
jgi:hypothetical protein